MKSKNVKFNKQLIWCHELRLQTPLPSLPFKYGHGYIICPTHQPGGGRGVRVSACAYACECLAIAPIHNINVWYCALPRG